ncbi:MAG: DUF721 domain-containing protein [Proteobacteria bacterium]|nr:DUF721 domain-containing protein [Pseudomonadota bacterium]
MLPPREMPSRSPIRTLSRVVADEPALAGWERRRARDAAILAVVARGVPRAVAGELAVADAASDVLVLAGPSGAVAAVLRQRVPDLQARLLREGWKFTAIRVVVQPRTHAAPPRKNVTNQLDRSAIPVLAELRDRLPEGPLRASVERLLRRR